MTRPAAVSTLRDRVVLEALVAQARPKIEKYLVSPTAVLWPRADDTIPNWERFEHAPLTAHGSYVVTADIAGYYESVDHQTLALSLAEAGVHPDLRAAIDSQLGNLMSQRRGLPQGIDTSDTLATLYLTPVDSALQRSGIRYWRHGDDYRMLASSYPRALQTIYKIEQAVRKRGLLLNPGKLTIESIDTYRSTLGDVDRTSEEFRSTMRVARERALAEATEAELAKAMDDAGLDEDMQWRFFYRRAADFSEVLEALAPSLTPRPVEIVEAMFRDIVTEQAQVGLHPKIAHARLTFCVRRLARAKSTAALPYVGKLLLRRPDITQDLANYMIALVDVDPLQVVNACQYALTNKVHILDWERAWIYRVLSRAPALVRAPIFDRAAQVAWSDSFGWLSRVEATRLLARAGRLTQALAVHVTNAAPDGFQGDLAGIIAMVERPGNWAGRYLDGSRQDPLQAVVIDGVRNKAKQQGLNK